MNLDDPVKLSELAIGEAARIQAIRTDGATERRLLDLGMVRGSVVRPILRSPSGDPVAYEVRGAVVALRGDVASDILALRGETRAHRPSQQEGGDAFGD